MSLYQLPDGNWIDLATVTGLRSWSRLNPRPGEKPAQVFIDVPGQLGAYTVDFTDDADAITFRDALAARVNAPQEGELQYIKPGQSGSLFVGVVKESLEEAAVLAERERIAEFLVVSQFENEKEMGRKRRREATQSPLRLN